MALDPCVGNILCTLSTPVLVSLRTLVTGQVAQIQALLAQLEARSITLGIQVIPIQVSRDLALAVLDQSQSIINLLPISLIQGCGDLGQVQQNLTDGVTQATSAVRDFADDATRVLSLKTEVDAQITQLNAQLTEFNEFLAEITNCITLNQSTP